MFNLKQFLLIGSVSSLSVFGGTLIAPVEARFIESVTGNSFLTGTVFAVGSVFFAFLSYWLGRLSDRYGRKKFILIGLGFGLLYALLYASVSNVLELYGIKFAWAVAAVGTGPLLRTYLQDFMAPLPNKGRLYGYLYSVQSIVGSAGALTGGYLATTYGITAPFYGLVVLALIMTGIVFFTFSDEGKPKAEEHSTRSFLDTVRYIVHSPPLIFYSIFNFSFGINYGIKFFIWPLIIFSLVGDDLVTGSVIATTGLVAFALLPFAGGWVDRYGVYKITFWQFLCLGSAGTVMALTDSITVFWIFVAIYTIGEVLNLAQIVLITEEVPSEIRGEILGFDGAVDQILMVMAPILGGLLIAAFSASVALLFFVSLYWVSLVLGFIVYRWKIATNQ